MLILMHHLLTVHADILSNHPHLPPNQNIKRKKHHRVTF
jgi:hypothetical protein